MKTGDSLAWVLCLVYLYLYLYGKEINEKTRKETLLSSQYFLPLMSEDLLIIEYFLQLKVEIAKCEKLKFDNIQRFVEGMRKEIVEWWDKCFFSREQREDFTAYFNGNEIS